MPFKICLAIPDQHTASSYYRGWLPYRHCKSILEAEGISLEAKPGMVNLDDGDAYVFYRGVNPENWAVPCWLAAFKKRPVYFDWDDHLLAIPEWSPAHETFSDQNQRLVAIQQIGLGKGLSVTTENLRQALNNAHKTAVLPNLIDPDDYPEPAILPREGKVTIYWGGSNSHEEDLRVIVPALRELRKEFKNRVDLVFNWYCPEWIEEDPLIHPTVMSGCAVQHYPAMMRVISPHVGLMPLSVEGDDLKFNVCKSPIKHFEMAMSGAVSLASEMPPYSSVIHEGHDGFLCAGVGGWTSQLCLVVDNFMCRRNAYRALRDCARDNVIKRHSWASEEQREIWLNWFRGIARDR